MLTLSDEEIRVLTGYKQQCKQLEELHAQGFSRARIVRGRLILERAHYDAVCALRSTATPKVHPPKVKHAATA